MASSLRDYARASNREFRRGGSVAGVTVDPDFALIGIDEVVKELNTLLKQFDFNTRRRIARKGAAVVREAERNNVKVGKPLPGERAKGAASVRYNTAKVFSGIRAPRNKGKIVARYYPGNLRRSIQSMTFRRSDKVYVGPRYGKGDVTGDKGKTVKTADGYYAHMYLGGIEAWEKEVVGKTIAQSANKAYEKMLSAAQKEISKVKNKTGM